MNFATVHFLAMFMSIPPWGLIPYGNIPLQIVGLIVQIAGLVLMGINFAVYFS